MNIYFFQKIIYLPIEQTDLFWYIILHIFQRSFEYALGIFSFSQRTKIKFFSII